MGLGFHMELRPIDREATSSQPLNKHGASVSTPVAYFKLSQAKDT